MFINAFYQNPENFIEELFFPEDNKAHNSLGDFFTVGAASACLRQNDPRNGFAEGFNAQTEIHRHNSEWFDIVGHLEEMTLALKAPATNYEFLRSLGSFCGIIHQSKMREDIELISESAAENLKSILETTNSHHRSALIKKCLDVILEENHEQSSTLPPGFTFVLTL